MKRTIMAVVVIAGSMMMGGCVSDPAMWQALSAGMMSAGSTMQAQQSQFVDQMYRQQMLDQMRLLNSNIGSLRWYRY